ncbi:MAG: ATP-binding protein [Spirochaetia bacterium]|jgi:DNA replication protein DnaC|nr:ATP-binding protein [Spirochaetia bacterium]
MSNIPSQELQKLRLYHTLENWNEIVKKADKENISYSRFLSQIIQMEYESKLEKERLARINRAKIPTEYSIETYPFKLQPKLNKKSIMEAYDSMNYIGENKNLLFIGPTGCGKTGLSTAFLIHALNHGYTGRFIDFSELIHILFTSRADHMEQKIVDQFVRYDILLIDELGYISCQKEQASLFFDLLRRRHGKAATIITTQLGFDEWGSFLHDPHIVAALLDRITSNCIIFNMKDCQSIRGKKGQYPSI